MGFFGFGKKKENTTSINWTKLESASQLDTLIKKESHDRPVVLFKHSTRCSISSMALNRLENYWDLEEGKVTPVYLDLIRYREISNKMANDLGVMHQSPQLLLVKNGQCIYTSSHGQIDVEGIKENI